MNTGHHPQSRKTAGIRSRMRARRSVLQLRRQGTSWAVGAGSACPGRWALVGACVLAGVVSAVGIQVVTSGSAAAGSSQLARDGISVVRLASLALLAVTAVAVLAVLIPGLSAQRATSARRAHLLALAGWAQAARVHVELAAWVARYLKPLALTVIFMLGGVVALGAYRAVHAYHAASPSDIAVPTVGSGTQSGDDLITTDLIHAALSGSGRWLGLAGVGAAVCLGLCLLIGIVGLASSLRATTPTTVAHPAPAHNKELS